MNVLITCRWQYERLSILIFHQQSCKIVSRYKWDINEGINTYPLSIEPFLYETTPFLYEATPFPYLILWAVSVQNESASLLDFLICGANLDEFYVIFFGFNQYTWLFNIFVD